MATLYILCGPPGSGKSTWARNTMNEYREYAIRYVSRDEIRFSILQDKEDYFSHEKEIFKKFVDTIRNALIDGFDVIADATHLNEFSRRKLTQAIDMYYDDYKITYVVFEVDVDVCIKRNMQRTGRAKVPENIIRNMCRDFRIPDFDEDTRVIRIIEIGDDDG